MFFDGNLLSEAALKISRRLLHIFLVTLALLAIFSTSAMAAGKPTRGSGGYTYDYISGCVRYTGENTWKWQNVGTSQKGNYTWSGSDAYKAYNACGNGEYLFSGGFRYSGHSVMRNGQTYVMQSNVQGRGIESYKYQWVAVNGTVKVNHYWYNGVLIK